LNDWGEGRDFEVWEEGSPTLLDLTEGFVEGDANGGGEVEASGRIFHGDAEAAGGVLVEEGFGETFGFAAEDEAVAVVVGGVPEGAGGFGGEEPEAGPLPYPVLKMEPGVPEVDVAVLPVVHAGAAEGFFVEGESEGLDEVESGAGGEAEAGDVAGVWGDFGFDEGDLEHGREGVRGGAGGARRRFDTH
jgi:hypothetical protein